MENPVPSSSIPALAPVEIVQWEDLLLANKCNNPRLAAGAPDEQEDKDEIVHQRRRCSDVLRALRSGLGSEGVGLVAVRGIPGFVEAKQALFSQAHDLVHLPPEYLEGHLSDPASLYNAGWSHGKEKLGANKPPDTAKASFYYNPLTDHPGTDTDRQQYPLSYPANRWPDPERMPNFEPAAVALGQLLHRVVVEVAQQVDVLAQGEGGGNDNPPSTEEYGPEHRRPHTYPEGYLHRHMKDTDKVKARLLYYYPLRSSGADDTPSSPSANDGTPTPPPPPLLEDSWIGWHNDSGFFTALAGDWYLDHSAGHVVTDPTRLDPSAGLYVESRSGQVLRVTLPDDCAAVQLGECTQIVTGGIVRATPHCVRGSAAVPDLARVSLACFVDVRPSVPLTVPLGCPPEAALCRPDCCEDPSSSKSTRPAVVEQRVPPLQDRWTDGMAFGDFLQTTFTKYYEWNDGTTN